jgi:methanogenic corrinoid protein MtbC1
MESLPQEYPAHDELPRTGPPPECRDFPVFNLVEAANDTRVAKLARTIEQEIIPRLMLAHRVAPHAPPKAGASRPRLGEADVQHFAKILLTADEDPTLDAVLAHRAAGASVEEIYLDLLAPAARYLGELWNEDLCSFADVTVGLGRLQRVLRELGPVFGRPPAEAAAGRSVLLVPSPGEQHTFGLVMVGEFFRSAGWNVSGGAWTTAADAAGMVESEWFDAIGFSLGAEVHRQALAECIRAVRQASCNQVIAVLVGGPLFGEHPEYAGQVGADGMTTDGREAPSLAARLSEQGAARMAGTRTGMRSGAAG